MKYLWEKIGGGEGGGDQDGLHGRALGVPVLFSLHIVYNDPLEEHQQSSWLGMVSPRALLRAFITSMKSLYIC
jgi:hypothetical protein